MLPFGFGEGLWQLDHAVRAVENGLAQKAVSSPQDQPVQAGTFGRHVITEWFIFPLLCCL